MVKILLVSHGNLAESFRDTAAMIAGSETAAGICCLGMTPEKDPEEFAEEAGRLLAEDLQADYLIFADLFGASPCNTCVSVFRSASNRMVTGSDPGRRVSEGYPVSGGTVSKGPGVCEGRGEGSEPARLSRLLYSERRRGSIIYTKR